MRHDSFTGVLGSEVTQKKAQLRKSRNSAASRQRRRVVLDDANSCMLDACAALPFCVCATKPTKTIGPKRNGAKATKTIMRLLCDGFDLAPAEATALRAPAARGNVLAADRLDIGLSAKKKVVSRACAAK